MSHTSVAQQMRLNAVSLKDHGSLVKKEGLRRAARRMEAGADQAYTEEGQLLLRSAAVDLRNLGPSYDKMSLLTQRVADYLELENDRLAGDFAQQLADELFVTRRSTEVER